MNKYCFAFLCLWCSTLLAQNQLGPDSQVQKLSPNFMDRIDFRAGYYGNYFWNPGLTFGTEYLLSEKVETKQKKRRTKVVTKQWLINGMVGLSWDPRTELGVFTNYGILWRRTNTKGKQLNFQFNPLGIYRAFLPETYEVSGDNVDRVFLPGRNYYAPSISLGFGKLRKGKTLSGRYLNITYMLRTPYNTNFLPSIAIEYGYRFNFKKKN
ncbi:hypothetical protein [Maribacter sp. 2210JD10-5]|uniref:hypothetical protein n=1 Tax=Maribacter sp. 2210JD10-5 TaxID=3386272 RepID=UPI0039BC97D9